jgi:hypothetical protein
MEYKIELVLMNQTGKIIAMPEPPFVSLTSNAIRYNSGSTGIEWPEGISKPATFKNIKLADLTDSIAVRIVRINDGNYENIIRGDKITIKKDTELTDRQLSKEGMRIVNTRGMVSVENYDGKAQNVIIPEFYRNLVVTAIGPGAFEKKKINKVHIPNNINTIEKRAFYDNHLSSVTIPKNIAAIGSWAFAKNSLVEMSIPSTVQTIDDWAFFRNKIKKIVIPANVTLGNNSFDNNFTACYQENNRSAGTYALNEIFLPPP